MKSPKLCQLHDKILEQVSNDRKSFLGKVLTVIDASISDPQQRKATKDLVNDAFYNHPEYFYNGMDWQFRMYAEATKVEYYKNNEPPRQTVTLDDVNPYKD